MKLVGNILHTNGNFQINNIGGRTIIGDGTDSTATNDLLQITSPTLNSRVIIKTTLTNGGASLRIDRQSTNTNSFSAITHLTNNVIDWTHGVNASGTTNASNDYEWYTTQGINSIVGKLYRATGNAAFGPSVSTNGDSGTGFPLQVHYNTGQYSRIQLKNTNATSGAGTAFEMHNDGGNGASLFLNSSTNTAFGGVNSFGINVPAGRNIAIGTQAAISMYMTGTTGNWNFGPSTSDNGYKVDITTSGTSGALRVQGTSLFTSDITSGGDFIVNTSLKGLRGSSDTINVSITGGVNTATGNAINITTLSSIGAVTGTRNLLALNPTINFSTGTNSSTMLNIIETVNTTGGTNTIRAIYVNPTITSLTGSTYIAFQNTVGNVLLGTTSGRTIIGNGTDSTVVGELLQITSNVNPQLVLKLKNTATNGGVLPTFDRQSVTGYSLINHTTNGTTDWQVGTGIDSGRSDYQWYSNTTARTGLIFQNTGNWNFGTSTTDSGYKVDITLSGTAGGLRSQQSKNQIGFLEINTTSINAGNTGVGIRVDAVDNPFRLQGTIASTGATSGAFIFENYTQATMNLSTQTKNLVTYLSGFNASTGTNVGGILNIVPTYNLTGGANTVRGIYYNPTLTSLTGTTHYAWENTTGDMRIGSTSGQVLIGNTGFSNTGETVVIRGNINVNNGGTLNNNINGGTNTFSAGLHSFSGPLTFIGAASNSDWLLFTNSPVQTSYNTFRINQTYTFSANTNTHNIFNISPTYNYTGGTNTVRGIYYNPTVTSTTGTTHIAYENTTGNVLLNTTSGITLVGPNTVSAGTQMTIGHIGNYSLTTYNNSTQTSNYSEYSVGVSNISLTDGNGANLAFLSTTTSASAATLTGAANIVAIFRNRTTNSVTSDLAFFTRTTTTAPTEKMRLFNTGNLALGQTSDNGYKFDVNGDSRFSGYIAQTYGTSSLNLITSGTSTPTTTDRAINIGHSSTNTSIVGIVLGAVSATSGTGGVAIGYTATSNGGIAISSGGQSASTTGGIAIGQIIAANNGIAIGSSISLTTSGIAIGSNITNAISTDAIIADGTSGVLNVYFGTGKTSTAAVGVKSYTINGSGGSGTNNVGGSLTLASGKATGTATGGDIIISTPSIGSSGSTLQSLSTRLTVKYNTGSVLIGTSTDNATDILQVSGSILSTKNKIVFTPVSDTVALDIRGNTTPLDYFTISNATGSNGVFLPIFFYKAASYGYQGGTNLYPAGVYGGGFVASVDDQSFPNGLGAGAAMHFNARNYTNNGALTLRYLFSWGNFMTNVMVLTNNGNLLINTTADLGVNEKIQVDGNVNLITAGNKIRIKSGSNASVGTATLSSGTITVNTTAVSATSIIMVTRNTPSGTTGDLSAPSASIVAGTSFTINSTSGTENSTVNWWIIDAF